MRFQRFVFQTGIKLRLQTLLKRLRQTSQYSNRALQQVAKSKFLLYIIQIRNLNLSFHISGSLPNHHVINSFGVTLALTSFVRASFLSKLLCVFRILCFFSGKLFYWKFLNELYKTAFSFKVGCLSSYSGCLLQATNIWQSKEILRVLYVSVKHLTQQNMG